MRTILAAVVLALLVAVGTVGCSDGGSIASIYSEADESVVDTGVERESCALHVAFKPHDDNPEEACAFTARVTCGNSYVDIAAPDMEAFDSALKCAIIIYDGNYNITKATVYTEPWPGEGIVRRVTRIVTEVKPVSVYRVEENGFNPTWECWTTE